MALADLDEILIRATYSTSTAASSIADVAMDMAVPPQPGLPPAPEVEECRCPPRLPRAVLPGEPPASPPHHHPPLPRDIFWGGRGVTTLNTPPFPPPPAGLCAWLHPYRGGAVPGALRAL